MNEGLAPLVYVQSSCDAPSHRDLFVEELGKYIKIDSYGKCLNNKTLPKQLSCAELKTYNLKISQILFTFQPSRCSREHE